VVTDKEDPEGGKERTGTLTQALGTPGTGLTFKRIKGELLQKKNWTPHTARRKAGLDHAKRTSNVKQKRQKPEVGGINQILKKKRFTQRERQKAKDTRVLTNVITK